MTLGNQELQSYLQAFDFTNLLVNGMGWDYYDSETQIATVDDFDYTLTLVAQKRGFGVWRCSANDDGEIPVYPIRRKIENQIAKLNVEHMVIFVDADETKQIWQWVKREIGKRPAYRETIYYKWQTGTRLLQTFQELIFTLEEEPELSMTAVTSRVRDAMDVEKVTRRFYDKFKKQLTEFQSFIEGIDDLGDKEWYASIMLNRMMFIYFIQKQGFMDDDLDYLRNRLNKVQKTSFGNGSRPFQDFYRVFLRRLFHEGLGQPENKRDAELVDLLGKVPFLNGGLFDPHDLEDKNPNISIPDKAFRKLFDFFNQYQWRLDDRPDRDDNEINPDVLGYIFEKYINQKQMGAYYTKEDITGYISRNTVIPFLFDAAKKSDHIAFSPEVGVWPLLQNDPDNYIYPAVKHGITCTYKPHEEPQPIHKPFELPDDIAAGIDDVSKRDGWNTPAPEQYALPTETWREVIARRQRYFEIHTKLAAGEVQDINDLITLNLDVERFAEDVITMSEGPDLVRAFWKAVSTVSVLDPTCGSGAFLFAALNILEPIYTACINGMQGFVDDLEITGRPYHPSALSDFKKVLEQVGRHPNIPYYILKSIVLNNLYGVDIMPEAVEICKLRLFLKLAAQLENYDHIEPLPDIDFNIRAGNTLVGFTSLDAVRSAMRTVKNKGEDQGKMMSEDDKETLTRIEEDARIANQTFDNFRRQQTWLNGELTTVDKGELRQLLNKLRNELDRYLASEYCIDPDNRSEYGDWLDSHQPFHWLVEFYGIMNRGGFDVIIGNPPYVEYSKVKETYTIKDYETESCRNTYAFVIERSAAMNGTLGRTGMIVPNSAICTDRMAPVQKSLLNANTTWISSYAIRPCKLFDGAEQRLCIYLTRQGKSIKGLFSSHYHLWYDTFRPCLFQNIEYGNTHATSNSILKVKSLTETNILSKLQPFKPLSTYLRREGEELYFHNAPGYWIRAMDFAPYFWNERDGQKTSSHVKTLNLKNKGDSVVTVAALNSSCFYWWFMIMSNCRDLNLREIETFPLGLEQMDQDTKKRLSDLTDELMADFKQHSYRKETMYRTTGKVIWEEFDVKPSKPILDQIDYVLAQHYGFTNEELDFIINYGIKYRMGIK